jgi:hypothetical protein
MLELAEVYQKTTIPGTEHMGGKRCLDDSSNSDDSLVARLHSEAAAVSFTCY